MDFTSFLQNKGRALPVFLLIDVSGSMAGEKIETVNIAVKEMLNTFKKIENPKGIIELSILTFADNKVEVVKPLGEIEDDDYFEFNANGNTPMGQAFTKVTELIEDYSVVDSRAYTPTIVLISDGWPTDLNGYSDEMSDEDINNWPELQKLLGGARSQKATRLAMGIGSNSDNRILKAFINNESIPVIKAMDTNTISKFFNWVTMSISVRSVSSNPNIVQIPDTDIFDIGEIEF